MEYGDMGVLKGLLDEMQKRGIIGKYAVGGAFAASLLNEPIATADLDIFFLFHPPQTGAVLDLSPIYEFVKEKGFTFNHEFIDIDGWMVQFIESGNTPLWQDAVEAALTVDYRGVDMHVIRPDFLVAMWLLSGRPKDYGKIAIFAEANLFDPKNFTLADSYGLSVEWERVKRRLFDED